ncbi:MAG: YbjQ family protein [Pirellulaceae bacterium]
MNNTDIMIVTSPGVPGKRVVRTLGLVRGSTIRARHIGKDIMAGLRTIVGGEIHEYGKLLVESREQALDRMLAEAEELGANAIISMQLVTSVVMGGAAEMLAYGTAVVVEDE